MHAIKDVSVARIVMANMRGFIVVARSMASYREHLESVVCNSLLFCGSDYSDVSCVDKSRANVAG